MRLSGASLDRLPGAVRRPAYDRHGQGRGIVHLGVGAFHRAHQAVYTDDAMAAGDRDWLITGVSLRSPTARDRLAPQDQLYTLDERSSSGDSLRVVGSIAAVLVQPEDPAAVRRALAAPECRIVTLTVTEKAYHRAASGVVDDVAVAARADTIYHHIAAAVRDRHDAGASPLTLLSCDNLTDNGHLLQEGVACALARHPARYRRWFDRAWRCPSSMVDRIVPATTAQDLNRIEAMLTLRDEAAVVTEPFAQWIVEDRFAEDRPRWEAGGARFVTDVKPFETAKLRMLNGAHSALAYLGLAAEHRFVHEAIADPAISAIVVALMRDEAASSFDPAPEQDLGAYHALLLARFHDPALPHRLEQIAADGSQKIGPRWLDSILDRRRRGLSSPATLAALAAWVLYARQRGALLNDPMAAELAALWQATDVRRVGDALFGRGGLLGAKQPLDAADLRLLNDRLLNSAS